MSSAIGLHRVSRRPESSISLTGTPLHETPFGDGPAKFAPLAVNMRQIMHSLRPGDHLCHIYTQRAEQCSLLGQFVSEGLQRNERVLCVVDVPSAANVVREVGVWGLRMMRHGSSPLEFLLVNDLQARLGADDPTSLAMYLGKVEQTALRHGFRALRVGLWMPGIVRDVAVKRFLEYLAALNALFQDGRSLGLFQYDISCCDFEACNAIMAAHPIVIVSPDALASNSALQSIMAHEAAVSPEAAAGRGEGARDAEENHQTGFFLGHQAQTRLHPGRIALSRAKGRSYHTPECSGVRAAEQ